MKNKLIWLFCISFFGIHFSNLAQNQKELISNDSIKIKSDSLIKNKYTLRFGFNPIKTILSKTEKNFNGFEFVSDFNILKNIYIALELGKEEKTKQSEQINFSTSGTYIKLGINYNMYKNWKGMNNQIYIGLRLANSLHKQIVNSFYLRNINFFWDDEIITSGSGIGLRENLNSSWIEFIAGIKPKY